MESEALIVCLSSNTSSVYTETAIQSGSLTFSSLQRAMRSIQPASNRHSTFQELAPASWDSQTLCRPQVCSTPGPHARSMGVTSSPPYMPLCAMHHMLASLPLRCDFEAQGLACLWSFGPYRSLHTAPAAEHAHGQPINSSSLQMVRGGCRRPVAAQHSGPGQQSASLLRTAARRLQSARSAMPPLPAASRQMCLQGPARQQARPKQPEANKKSAQPPATTRARLSSGRTT